MSTQPLPNETHERSRFDAETHARAVAYVKDHGLSVGQFADLLDYSRTTLAKYLAHDYTNCRAVEARLKAFFAREERVATGSKFHPTAVAQEILECCQYALDARAIVLIYGSPGLGKTTTVMEFIRRRWEEQQARDVVFVTASSITTPYGLVRNISAELGVSNYGCTHALVERILAELKRRPHLLIVDEANHLSIRSLELLRSLHDLSACGLLLMGSSALMQRIFSPKGRTAEDLEQFRSRIDYFKCLSPGATAREDLAAVARAHGFDEQTFDLVSPHVQKSRELLKLCRRFSLLRQLNPHADPKKVLEKALAQIFRAA